MAKKSWPEKMASPTSVQIEIVEKPFAGAAIGDRMAILTPGLIDSELRNIARGSTLSAADFRNQQAKHLDVAVVCPLTTGIFLRIVSENALEEIAKGASLDAVAPFWRMVSPKDALAKKLTCGPEWIAQARRDEGIVEPVKPKLV